jgi:hypothetical protein
MPSRHHDPSENPRRSVRRRAWLAGLALGVLVVASPARGEQAAGASPSRAPSSPQWSVAARVSESAGQPGRASKVTGGSWVAVFDETHTSRLGQLEIALMLYRLHRDHGLRHIALEGYVHGTAADASWFHALPGTPAERKGVATGLLQEGELSSAEYMAALFPDLQVHPIEDAAQYQVELADGAGGAGFAYLLRVALKGIEDPARAGPHAGKINALQQQKKTKELLEYILTIDPWVAEKARLMRRQEAPVQAEEWVAALTAIERKAAEVGAQIPAEDRQNMTKLIAFFQMADDRSRTMVAATASVASRSPKAPVAMIIGAAHTSRVVELLEAGRQPYVVISPLSLSNNVQTASLSHEAFGRKGRRLSVDESGLGTWLDGRKKPPPVIGESWLRAKAGLFLLTSRVAVRAAGGGQPPPPKEPPFGLAASELEAPLARVVAGTIRREEDDVVFQAVVFPDDEARKRALWVRTRATGAPVTAQQDADVETLLTAALDKARAEPPASSTRRTDSEPAKTEPAPATPLVQVSSDAIARFSAKESGVKESLLHS